MSSHSCSSPTLGCCGKRPRTPETPVAPTTPVVPSFRESLQDAEEPFAKMPRPSVPKNSHARLPRDNESVPLAPRLSDYMAPGGTIRYRPRPEWYLTRSKNRKNPPNADKEGVPKVAAAAFVDVDVVLEIPVVNDRGIEDASIAPAVAPNPNNPSLLVAPADGLLPEGAFQDYSVVVQEAAVGGEPEQPQPLCASNVPDQKQAANESKQGSCSRNHNNDDVLLADSTPPEPETTKPCFFGKDWDTALNLCIRENATEAALALLERGAPVDVENAKGITPIILSAQKGNYTVVRELLLRGANPGTSSTNGTTALLQAAHFGHGSVVELLLLKGSLGLGLINHCNYNHTTPLMRASQEGHLKICRCLLSSGAQVNRQNRVQMTALMLAAQRGHAEICQLLIDYGAELDAMTASQQSTSLLLACKRGNVEVVRVLVTAGCELWIRDSKGRTAREIARRREHKELADLLDETMQVDMMQRQGRRERSVEVVRLWNLLQQERAKIEIEENEMVSIHQINSILEGRSLPFQLTLTSTRALLQTMTLPFPLVESIAQYLPLPHLWSKRMGMLTKRSLINADAAVTSALDLIDEILEEGGYLAACDAAQVTPPTHFESWNDWKAWARRHGRVAPSQLDNRMARPNVTTATVPSPKNPEAPTFIELRRQVGFLQILANRSTSLARVLGAPPYNMPPMLIQQLITSSDIASLTRRMGLGGVHFEASVAMDLVMLISRLCAWYWRERERSTSI